jgi:hypothetical protein
VLIGVKGVMGRDQLVLQNNGPQPLALRYGSWKLIRNPSGAAELDDLATDPSEKKGLAAAQPDRVKELAARLIAEQAAPKS